MSNATHDHRNLLRTIVTTYPSHAANTDTERETIVTNRHDNHQAKRKKAQKKFGQSTTAHYIHVMVGKYSG
jgi:hypothetical protein